MGFHLKLGSRERAKFRYDSAKFVLNTGLSNGSEVLIQMGELKYK